MSDALSAVNVRSKTAHYVRTTELVFLLLLLFMELKVFILSPRNLKIVCTACMRRLFGIKDRNVSMHAFCVTQSEWSSAGMSTAVLP